MAARPQSSFRISLPIRVFIVGCVLSVLAAMGVWEWLEMQTVRRVLEQANNLEARVTARIAAYSALLRGTAGYLTEHTGIGRDEFRRYVRQLEVEKNYPGVQGVGVTLRVHPSEAPAVVARARREGWTEFRIWPGHERPEYHTILFLEPQDARNRAAIGYDMHTEPVRQAAMDRARDTGQPAITGKVTLVQEIDAAKQAGFLIYHAFYSGGDRPTSEPERRERLLGFAYAPFRAGDFLSAIVELAGFAEVNVALYDSTIPEESALILRTGEPDAENRSGVVRRVRSMMVLHRPWTFVYTSEMRGGGVSPILAFLLGMLVTTATSVLFMRIERTRRRAERSEAATRAREGELALLIDAVPALVAFIDKDRSYRLSNRRYDEWMARDGRPVTGRRVQEVVGTAVYAEISPHLRRALAGETSAFERWHNTPGAGARYLGTVYVPHRGEDGQVDGVFALSSDLTSHKRAEESATFIADSGKLLIASMDFESTVRGIVHLAVPRIADVAVLFRTEGGDLRPTSAALANADGEPEFQRLLGAVRLPISGTTRISQAARSGVVIVSSELNAPELAKFTRDENERRILQALNLRSSLHVPVVVRGKTWAVFSFGMSVESGRQFTDEHRQLAEDISTRVRLTVENALLYREAQQEVEVRRRAERVAREAEERFRLLVESVRDYAIMALDSEGRIESWNDGAQRILGYEEQEAIGMAGVRFYTVADREAGTAEEDLRQARDRGAASNERWYQRKDDTQFWASSHIVVLRDEETENIRGYAWIMRDLTDRKRMEDELELRVEERTAELNEAVHELEAFSYSVSHDLRAPLRTIRGFSELVMEEAGDRLTEEERGYLERVHRASSRLDRLISDLLAYTRVSKTKVELRPVDLNGLVTDIQREHPEFQPPRADVKIEAPLMKAIGNEAYLTQCVTNLVGNAVKFVKPGHQPVVRISTERHGTMVRLFVRDNGIGIPAERLSRAFEMFERLHTTGSYEGTGVGLAIVRRAVQRMKGHVGVTSHVGEGTTFWIELPAAD